MNDFNIDDNYILLMGHIITIDDMIDDLYYRTDIAWVKNIKSFNLLYFTNLNENEKFCLNNLITDKLYDAIKNANDIKPIFRYINDDLCNKYNLYTIKYKKSSRDNNYNIPIKIIQTSDNNINENISNLEPFYSTLKFKIKEEKITRNVRNDLNLLKKSNYTNFINLSKEIRELKNTIRLNNEYYNNEILNIKKYLYLIIIFIIGIILY